MGCFNIKRKHPPAFQEKTMLGWGACSMMEVLIMTIGCLLVPCSFSLGRVVITPNAAERLDPDDVALSLQRHAARDWGLCCPQDAQANDDALRDGCRLLSAYRDRHGVKFWIITEADRSVTTILLPEDY